jgi:cation diffusion facilitator family transporter
MNSKAHSVSAHEHIFLGASHSRNEKRTWAVIVLCGTMMLVEIVGGLMFGSIALVADGLHMSTHAGALLLTALAYSFSRRHTHDPRFTFGTGKVGDLAGFASAIVLAMIALLIGYEAVTRFMSPVTIHFGEAIPIACLGLAVNLASAFLLGADDDHGHHHRQPDMHPHFAAHEHHRDNNMRAAAIHVMADATVSVLVIVGLLLARWRGWLFMDPLAGLIGAFVIASWSYGLIRDTGAILLDMNPDRELSERIRHTIDGFGDQISDLHLWRLGPGHLGAIVEVRTKTSRDADFYRAGLEELPCLSHLTVEVVRQQR